MRRRGELSCGESVPIHRLVVLHVARRVSPFSRSELPLLNITTEQMGHPKLHVLLLGVHASQIHLVTARCMWLAPHLSCSFQLTATLFLTLGHPDLCWWSWDARRI